MSIFVLFFFGFNVQKPLSCAKGILKVRNLNNKVTGNKFCTPITIKNPLKTGFSIRNILIQFVSSVFEL